MSEQPSDVPDRAGRRRTWPRWVAMAVLVVVAAAAWIGLRGLSARDDLDAARAQLEAARTALLDRDLDAARAAISAAGESTDRARSRTGDPVWRVVGALPVVGNNVAVVSGLAEAADDVARRVLPTALRVAQGLDPSEVRRPDGRVDLPALQRVTPDVATTADRAQEVSAAVDNLDTRALVPPVAEARRELSKVVGELTSSLEGARSGLEVAPALLGGDRARRYLLLVQQTSESRGTGGVPGGYAEIVARGGKLDVVSQGSNAALRNGRVAAPPGVPQDWVARYRDQGSLDLWQNVNVSPDLPVVAKVVEARWRAQGGAALDGVMTIDAKGLQLLLTGSGPVDLGGGRSLDPEQIEQFLAVGQYEGLASPSSPQTLRKEQLDRVAGAAALKLSRGGGDSTALLRGLSRAVRTGHLRMASDDPALRPVLARTGVDGALPAGEAPVAYPVVFNATGGKLDYFLDRSVRYEAGSCSGDRRRAVITTTLTSQVPSTPLPPYLTIRIEDESVTQSRVNRVALMVYGTRGAKVVAATLDGEPVSAQFGRTETLLQVDEEAGLPIAQVYLDLPPGEPRTFAVELDEPIRSGAVRIPEQPLARPLAVEGRAPACV